VLSARPKVAELSFRLFSRSLHPELFEVYKSRVIQRELYQVRLDITGSGHVITWTSGTAVVSEVATSSQQPLPTKRELFAHALKGTHAEQIDVRGGTSYRTRFAIETATSDMFFNIQQQLSGQESPDSLLHTFDSSGRICWGGVSLMHVEARRRKLRIRAIHTFPDDGAVVKVESIFSTNL
jgi:hypothetical protein